MPPIGREEFREALRDLAPGALARFVADLHRARGATVKRSGTRIRVTDGDRSSELVVLGNDAGAAVGRDPHPDPGPGTDPATDPDTDAVVAVVGDDCRVVVGAGEFIDAAALHRLLLYGIDRTTCSALVERHLGRPLDSFDGEGSRRSGDPGMAAPAGTSTDPSGAVSEEAVQAAEAVARSSRKRDGHTTDGVPGSGEGSGGGTPDSSGDRVVVLFSGGGSPRRWLHIVAVLALVAVAGVAAALGGGLLGTSGDGTTESGSPVSPTGGPEPAAVDATTALERAELVDGTLENGLGTGPSGPPSEEPRFGRLPPGVNASGDIDERIVAQRTVASLSNRSYRLTLVVRESVDGRPSALRRETIRVENATTYSASVARAGRFVTGPPRLADGDVYADGSDQFVRGPNGTVRSVTSESRSDVPYATDLGRYIRWYLSVSDSTVADATTDGVGAVWLWLDGDPYPGVVNATGTVLLDRRGVLGEVHREYENPTRPGVRIEVTLRVEVGGVELSRPTWVEGRGNRSRSPEVGSPVGPSR